MKATASRRTQDMPRIIFQELSGSPEETYTTDDFTAVRKFLVPWADRYDFADWLRGATDAFGSRESIAYPNRPDVEPHKIHIKPFDAASLKKTGMETPSDALNSYSSFALVTVYYKILTSQDLEDGPTAESGTRLSYRINFQLQTVDINGSGLYWNGSTTSLGADAEVEKDGVDARHGHAFQQRVQVAEVPAKEPEFRPLLGGNGFQTGFGGYEGLFVLVDTNEEALSSRGTERGTKAPRHFHRMPGPAQGRINEDVFRFGLRVLETRLEQDRCMPIFLSQCAHARELGLQQVGQVDRRPRLFPALHVPNLKVSRVADELDFLVQAHGRAQVGRKVDPSRTVDGHVHRPLHELAAQLDVFHAPGVVTALVLEELGYVIVEALLVEDVQAAPGDVHHGHQVAGQLLAEFGGKGKAALRINVVCICSV